MQNLERPFIPAQSLSPVVPLSRYLPPLPYGMITSWLAENLPAGSLVLEPFCANPLAALEIARAGYRVLVTSNNPILTLMLEVLAEAPPESEFEAAIAALAAARRGEERLELHIQNLYKTRCAACGAEIQAEAYLWQRDQPRPYARIYHCSSCGDEGERAITPFDLERLALVRTDAMHRARAMSRVVHDGQPVQRESVEEALKTYPPRPLYVLTTLINKLEGLALSPGRKKYLEALLVSLCDEANTLWQWPSTRPRPRQLTVPGQYRENNLWLALEAAVKTWSTPAEPVPLVHWPALPQSPSGICLFPGRIKSLLPLKEEMSPAAIITAVPRPNQAFWTLCALWSGWLWGRDAVAPLHGALERRHYDWHWMAHALHTTLDGPNQQLPPGTRFFAIATELSTAFLLALFIAPGMAGFGLSGAAIDQEEDIAQFWWRSREPVAVVSPQSPKTISQRVVHDLLNRLGEPTSYQSLYSASLLGLAGAGLLPDQISELTPDYLGRTQATLAEVLKNRSFAVRFSGKSQSEDSGMWWLAGEPETEAPLADRLERIVVDTLISKSVVQLPEIENQLNQAFPGLITPSNKLIETCLASYAEPVPGQPGAWKMREQEKPSSRRAELASALRLLDRVAASLGYTCQGEEPLFWIGENGKPVYLFHLMASSMISRFVLAPQPLPPRQSVLVLPGSRASLLSLKIERDPRLRNAIDAGWHIMKFRLLRQIASISNLSLNLWEDLLEGDPPRWEEATQMSIFSRNVDEELT